MNDRLYKYILPKLTEHVMIAERALGKRLPPLAEVHHVNGKRRDNRNVNLVICQDRAYHAILHIRTRAFEATGNVHARMCTVCKCWDDPRDPSNDLVVYSRNGGKQRTAVMHRSCRRRTK